MKVGCRRFSIAPGLPPTMRRGRSIEAPSGWSRTNAQMRQQTPSSIGSGLTSTTSPSRSSLSPFNTFILCFARVPIWANCYHLRAHIRYATPFQAEVFWQQHDAAAGNSLASALRELHSCFTCYNIMSSTTNPNHTDTLRLHIQHRSRDCDYLGDRCQVPQWSQRTSPVDSACHRA